jgi:leader peptidase (prepilin peptidase)/N-methyltransferase
MNIFKLIIFGLAGLIIGYKIPKISTEIIEYKKRKTNNNIESANYNSRIFTYCLCIFNTAAWILGSIYVDNAFIALLICIQITLGIIVAFIDIKIRIIPNELVLVMFVLGIIFQTVNYGLQGILGSIVCMIVIMVIFTAVAGFMGFGKVGAGDVKLAGAIGFSLGYPLVVVATLFMAIVLLAYILIGLALKKIALITMLPLAPFLAAGYIFSLLTLVLGVNLY